MLENTLNIPRCYFYGEDSKSRVLALELLGLSLEALFKLCGRHLSLKTVLMLADQILTTLEHVHNRHFVHCDVKPDNFCIGLDDHPNQLFLIDFGLSRKYRDPTTLAHIPDSNGRAATTWKVSYTCSCMGLKAANADRKLEQIYFLKGR
jgi:serine/threonine protein kinase